MGQGNQERKAKISLPKFEIDLIMGMEVNGQWNRLSPSDGGMKMQDGLLGQDQ